MSFYLFLKPQVPLRFHAWLRKCIYTYLSFVLPGGTVLLCSLGYPWTRGNAPASDSPVLGWRECITTPGSVANFNLHIKVTHLYFLPCDVLIHLYTMWCLNVSMISNTDVCVMSYKHFLFWGESVQRTSFHLFWTALYLTVLYRPDTVHTPGTPPSL